MLEDGWDSCCVTLNLPVWLPLVCNPEAPLNTNFMSAGELIGGWVLLLPKRIHTLTLGCDW
jgi:hypothetical protein